MVLYEPASALGLPVWLLAVVLIWSIVWKGFALWKSARRKHPVWFIILLIVNTVGILEILYIFLFSEIKLDQKQQTKRAPVRKKPVSKKRKSR